MIGNSNWNVLDNSVEVGGPKIWICEVQGHDIEGNGTEKMPFRTLLKALEHAKGPKASFQVRKVITENYQPAAKAAVKKATKIYDANVKRAQKAAEKAAADEEERKKNDIAEQARIEESKNIVLQQDALLPPAVKIPIRASTANRGKRVVISGWVHRLRVQGKDMMFIVVRDGTGYIQAVLTGKLVTFLNQSCHIFE